MLRSLLIAGLAGILISGCVSSYSRLNHALTTTRQSDFGEAGKRIATSSDAVVGMRRDIRPVTPVTAVVPTYAFERSCRSGSSVIEGKPYENCIKQEDEAKRHLGEEWKSYPVAARAECSTVDGASYVELLTCFEVKDWMRHPDKIGGVTGAPSEQAREESGPTAAAPNSATSDDVQP
jgi:hypothetical protein